MPRAIRVTGLEAADLAHRVGPLMDILARRIPRGLGRGGVWKLDGDRELDAVLRGGSRYAVQCGFGEPGTWSDARKGWRGRA